MPTYKAEVYAHQKKKDGTYNIKIRVTHNKQKKYIATPYFVTAADLTRNLKIKNQRYIDYCNELIHKYRLKSDALGTRIDEMTVEQIVDYITAPDVQQFSLDFFEFAEKRIEVERSEGRRGTANNCANALHVFKCWCGVERLDINYITREMAQGYLDHLKKDRKPTTIVSYINLVSKYYTLAEDIYNEAEANIHKNPFKSLKLPKMQVNTKKALTVEQVRQIIVYKPKMKSEEIGRDVFLLSFFLIGMNIADLYNCTQIEGRTITYNREKTKNRRTDRAEMQVDVQPEALELVNKYKGRERVFNFVEHYLTEKKLTAAVDHGLERIASALGIERFSFYSARHSWATIAATEAGIDIYTVHLALIHRSTLPITELYIKRDFKAVNDANRKVLDLFL